MLRELLHRRVPQFLIAYFVAGWGLVQVLQFIEDRYALSPTWVDLFVAFFLLMVPAVMVFAWSQGAPGQDKWTRRQVVSIGINLVSAVVLLGVFLADRDLGAVTTEVQFENEDGEAVVREVPKADYRRSLALFHPTDGTDDPDRAWWADAIAYLVELDLFQDAALHLRSAYQNREAAQRRGLQNCRDLTRPMRREIADRANFEFFLDGEVGAAGESVVLTLTVHEVRSGRQVSRGQFRGDLFTVADEGSAWVRQQLGIPPAALAVSPDLPVADLCTDSEDALRQYVLGLDVAVDNDWEGARPFFDAAVELDPTFCLAHLQRYGVYVFGTDRDQATAAIEAAMQHAYRVPERMQFLIKSTYYSAKGDQAKGMAVLEMWAQLSPRDPVVHKLLAQQYRYRGDSNKAIASLERVVELLPEDAATLRDLATNYEDQARFAEAERIHRRVIDLYPEQASGLRALANCFEKQGRLEEAAQTLERASLLDPNAEGIHRNLAALKGKMGRFEEAERELRALADEAKSDADRMFALDVIGALYLHQGRMDEAVGIHEEWIESARKAMNPGEFVVRQAVETGVYAMAGRGEEGLERLQRLRASISAPFNRFIGFGDLIVNVEMDRPEDARVHLESVRSVCEEFGLASMRPTLDYYEARIFELEGEPSKALALVAEDVTLLGGRGERLWLRGRLQRRSGDLELAQQTLERCLALRPGFPRARLELARTLHARGETVAAIVELDRALESWSSADPGYEPAAEARSLRESWRSES